jgi:hypothetical protein
MKTHCYSLCLLFGATLATPSPGQAPDYSVTERGPHHRVLASVTWTTNAAGRVLARTNSYTELATGLHYLLDGHWTETREEIALLPGGFGAAATNGLHQLYLPADIYQGVIETVAPDGQRLRSRPLAITYFDGTNSVLVATLTNSIGQLLPSGNWAIYTNAFSGLAADILLTYRKCGVECDLVFREAPAPPAAYDLARSSRLQLWTEFYDTPDPTIIPVPPSLSDGLADATLDWGAIKMTRGRAFATDRLPGPHGTPGPDAANTRNSPGTPVYKSWHHLLDPDTKTWRKFLIEEVPHPQLEQQLNGLGSLERPARWLAEAGGTRHHGSPLRLLPLPQPAQTGARAMQMAQTDLSQRPGLVLDYVEIVSSCNLTFRGDTTYYVSGPVYLNGTNVFEGGTVIKYATNAGITLTPSQTNPIVTFATSAYRPVICTAKDDDSLGEPIAGSTGTPAGYYANPALGFTATQMASAISYVRLSHARLALDVVGVSPTVSHAQVLNCQQGVDATGSTLELRNVLFADTPTMLAVTVGYVTALAENVTFARGAVLVSAPSDPNGSASSLALTNCILANVTNIVSGRLTATNGDHNAFYESPAVGINIVSNPSGAPFITVGAASHYLADNSPYRNAGTTNINSDLLADLRHKTTYPPIVYSNVVISADTTLGPQAQRDTDLPDLGYHYDPLDYACKVTCISNAVVRLLPGTAIATFGPNYGLAVRNSASLISEGTPTHLNHMVRYNLVQECANNSWDGRSTSVVGDWWGGLTQAQLRFRFTQWSTPAQDTSHFETGSYAELNDFVDCQFHGGSVSIFLPSLYLTNCLLDRVSLLIDDDNLGLDVSPVIRNGLFFGGTLTLNHNNADTWLFRDNLFDQTSIVTNIYGSALDLAFTGYTPGSTWLMPTNADDVVASIAWETGPLGNYYQPTNSAFLTNGSIAANLVGLYHYTVLTNQVGEATNTVSIGFHYLRVDSNGNPADTDSDGIAGYYEDTNGNGLVDSGETDWNSAADLGLKVLITRPKDNSLLP